MEFCLASIVRRLKTHQNMWYAYYHSWHSKCVCNCIEYGTLNWHVDQDGNQLSAAIFDLRMTLLILAGTWTALDFPPYRMPWILNSCYPRCIRRSVHSSDYNLSIRETVFGILPVRQLNLNQISNTYNDLQWIQWNREKFPFIKFIPGILTD